MRERARNWRSQRRDEGLVRIRKRRPEHRLDHRHALVRKIDIESVGAIVESYAHEWLMSGVSLPSG